MIIVGIDPGGTTGICIVTVNPDEDPTIIGIEATNSSGVANIIFCHEPDLVVIEDYIIGPRASVRQTHDAIEIIGVVEYICSEINIPVIRQSPSILSRARKFVKRDVHSSRHVKSAYAHIIYYLVKNELSQAITW